MNLLMQAVAYAGIITGRGFKTETRYNDVILYFCEDIKMQTEYFNIESLC